MRTFALLGVHGCVAVTAVTVQNSVGVKGFHEIPARRHRRPDRGGGRATSGYRPPRPACWRRPTIIATVADTWRAQGLAGTVPLVVDPVCASMHGDPLLHPSALDSLRDRTVSARHAGDAQPRRGAAARRHRRRRRRLPARGGPRPARAGPAVGAGQGRAPAVLAAQPRPAVRRHRLLRVRRRRASTPATTTAPATRWPPPSPARWRTATRCPTRWRSPSVGDRMSARRLPVGPRPRPGVAAVPAGESP